MPLAFELDNEGILFKNEPNQSIAFMHTHRQIDLV